MNKDYWQKNKQRLFQIFNSFKTQKRNFTNNPVDQNVIYAILETIPSHDILGEFIFNQNYGLIIRHDALIKAIELDMQEIIEQVLIYNIHPELVRTAINHLKNDQILKNYLLKYRYSKSPITKKILKQGLLNFSDPQKQIETIKELFTQNQLSQIFQQIVIRNHYSKLPQFLKMMIPTLIQLLSSEEVFLEFQKSKYPNFIRTSAKQASITPIMQNIKSKVNY